MSIIGVIAPAKDAGRIGAINTVVQAKARPVPYEKHNIDKARSVRLFAGQSRLVTLGPYARTATVQRSACASGSILRTCQSLSIEGYVIPIRRWCWSCTLCSRALEPNQTMIVRRKTTRDA